jgi:hypothetical protein
MKLILLFIATFSLNSLKAQVELIYVDLSTEINREKLYNYLLDEFINDKQEAKILYLSNDKNPIIIRDISELKKYETALNYLIPNSPNLFFDLETLTNLTFFSKLKSIRYISGEIRNLNEHFIPFINTLRIIYIPENSEKINLSLNVERPLSEIKLKKINEKFFQKYNFDVEPF